MDWPAGTDALPAGALENVELPLATKQLLRAGLPREVRIPGWVGPTLFSSEVGAGLLSPLARFAPALETNALAQAFVIGTVRETDGPPTAYSAFCLQPTRGDLWLVDIAASHTRFVNSALDLFLRSVRAFLDAWARAGAVPDQDLPAVGRDLRAQLEAIDAKAFTDQESYWLTWLDTEFESS